jgi:aspartate aminotransferase
METVLKFGQARLCPPTLEQIGAQALVNSGSRYIPEMLREYKRRRDIIFEELTNIPDVQCEMPQGAFYLMVSFPVDDIEDFSRWLLSEFQFNGETTMIAPGPGFYATPGKGRREARIAYILNTDDLRNAVRVIKQGLEIYNN